METFETTSDVTAEDLGVSIRAQKLTLVTTKEWFKHRSKEYSETTYECLGIVVGSRDRSVCGVSSTLHPVRLLPIEQCDELPDMAHLSGQNGFFAHQPIVHGHTATLR